MSRIAPPSHRLQSRARLMRAAEAAGYAVADYQEAERETEGRFGRLILALVFAPLVLAVTALAALALNI